MDVLGDRFELGELAGAGAMGTVFRAKDRVTGEIVAVKVLATPGGHGAERFEREAKLLAALRHDAIVRYVAHGHDGKKPWLAMQWLAGEDLGARLKRGALSMNETLSLLARVAEGLGLAHALGVVHRDLKPSNIFLEGGELVRAKVIDFGVARADGGSDDSAITATGVMVGTPHYMAPEQARGLRACDPAADVYALGCLLFTCVALRPPFMDDDLLSGLVRVVLEPAPRLSEVLPGVDPRVEALVARMLAKDPTERPADGSALVQEIAALGEIAASRASPRFRSRLPTLGGGEQRLLGLVIASGERRAPAGTELLAPGTALLDSVRSALTDQGGAAESLADGSTLVVLTGRGAATDLALRTARAAVALRPLLADCPMALVTGLGDASGAFPIGDVLDNALALVKRAAGGRNVAATLVDATTAALLESRFELADAEGGAKVLLCERAEPVRTLLGKETACVGRDRELAVLEACFGECVDEPRARPVIVSGDVGVGKTRVGYEFLHRVRARAERVAIWIARGDPTSAGSPLGLLGQVVRRAADIVDGEPLPDRRRKVREKAAIRIASPEARGRVAEFLGELAGAPFGDDASLRLRAARSDPMLMADQLRAAFQELVFAECRVQPVVIVLEDVQWGDRPTLAFLDAALAAAGELPLLVVALGRPEIFELFPDLWSHRDVSVVRLGPIGKKAAEKFVMTALPEADGDKVAMIVERAAGNAFFLEELIRASIESPDEPVPGTVLATIQARLEALDPESRKVLRAGSIFGQTFWSGGVGALIGEGERSTRVEHVLEALASRELVTRRATSRFSGEDEHAFRHGVVRDAAYATLTDEDRTLGHRLVAGWLERAGERDALTLAEHHELGGEPDAAAARYLETVQQALDANDLASAIERATRAADAATKPEVRGAARALEASALLWTGRLAEAETRADEALGTLERASSPWIDAATTSLLASGGLGRIDRVIELAETLGSCLDEREENGREAAPLVVAASRAAGLLCAVGRFEAADALLRRVDEVPDALLERQPGAAIQRASARTMRSLYAGDIGGFLEGMELDVAYRETIGDLRAACASRIAVGFACIQLGAYARAEETLRESLAAAEKMGLLSLVASARNHLSTALAMLDKFALARGAATRAIEAFEAQGDRAREGGSRIRLAEGLAREGKLDLAHAEILAAVEIGDATPTLRCRALAGLSRILLARGEIQGALERAREASALLDELGGLDDGEAVVRLALVESLAASGDTPAAIDAARAAKERLLARAAKIQNFTYRASFLQNVPENAATIAIADRLAGS